MNAIEYARRQYLKKKYPVSTSGYIAVILVIVFVTVTIIIFNLH